MKVAVIGSGVAGMGAAWRLSREHEVVLFEREARLGGHTHTHKVTQGERSYSVDSGFIVFNADNYPLFSRMLDELGVPSQPTTMSFSVQDARSGLEYNATDFDSLFCQRRNLVSPRFWGMLRDILRFYREAPALLALPGDGPSLGDYLRENRYSAMFIEDHLVPMASALWSSPSETILDFPAKYLVRFMDNHHMLQVQDRPPWRVVSGGSSSYIPALQRDWNVQVRTSRPVRSVRRTDEAAWVRTDDGEEAFDHVVLACHSDQALALFARSRDLSPRSAHVHNNIGYTLLQADRLTEARLALKLALELEPGSQGEADEPLEAISFYPQGHSSGGVIRLSAADGRQFEIQVDWLTARVQLHD